MTPIKTAGAAALALWLAATGDAAALTADAAWDDLRAMFEGTGIAVEAGTPVRAGATLRVPEVALEQAGPGGGMSADIGEIRFTERAGGEVEIGFPERYAMTIRGETEAEAGGAPVPTQMRLEVAQPGLSLVASGEGEARTYVVAAPEVTLTGSDFREGGEPVEASLAAIVSGIAGTYEVSGAGPRELESAVTATSLELTFDAPADESGGRGQARLLLSELSSTGTATLVEGGEEDLGAAIEAGFATEGRVSYGTSTFALGGEDASGTFSFAGASGAGVLDVALGPDGLGYTTRAEDVTIEVGGTQIPIPGVSATMASAELGLTLPLLPGAEAAPYRGTLRLVELALSESVWSLFDPAAVLPRDPATVRLDLAGDMRLDRPLLEEPSGEDAAGSLETLEIRELAVSLAGAALSGTGQIAFDATDTATYGMPKPVGQVDLRLTGLEALIDRLVTLGVIPPDQLLATRMMIGAFARQVEGEDTLTSTIEFTPDGQVLANGARVR